MSGARSAPAFARFLATAGKQERATRLGEHSREFRVETVSIPTKDEIIHGAAAAGLVPYLLGLRNGYSPGNNKGFAQTVAGLVASGRVQLRAEGDSDRIAAMEDWAFFAGQHVLCRLIPELDVDHRQMMDLVATLVRRGGDDGAATLPNKAFLQWCAQDGKRVDMVVEDARNGLPLSVDHLCFALEAGGRVDQAIAFLGSNCSQSAASAAGALGRMDVDAPSGARSLAALSKVSSLTEDEMVLHHALRSCFAVLGRHPDLDRKPARVALNVAAERGSPEARHAAAHLLADHGDELTEDETQVALRALEGTAPEYGGTINLIDLASSKLVSDPKFSGLTSLVTKLIKDSGGRVTLDTLPVFREEILREDRQRLRVLTVAWLLDGDPQLCGTLSSMLTKIHREPLRLELAPEQMPEAPADQVLVCRRAVGFLFIAPVTAASILISMLKHGAAEAAEEVAQLLYDPLLVNFSGELRSYVQDVAERHKETFGGRIREALDRTENVATVDGLPPLTEVRASDECKHIERLNRGKAMTELLREGARRSIMRQLVEESTLLYGNASTFYVEDADNAPGQLRRIDVPMMSHSVSMEMPRLSIFDPEGLEQMLWFLKSGTRSEG